MSDDGVRHYNRATWRVHRAREAQQLPELATTHVALPGAKQAIPHERLRAYHDADVDQHDIVARTNQAWTAEHADRLAAHHQWVAGPYADAIETMRGAAAEAAAEELRRRAIFEQIMAEREHT